MFPEEIFKAYDLDKDAVKVEVLQNGLINATWKIISTEATFILQKINTEVFKNPGAIAANVRLISDYLSQTNPGYLFAAQIPTVNGEELLKINADYYRLIPFVSDSHTISTVEKPEQAYEAAKKFGEFTRLLSGFAVEKLQVTIPDFHNLSLRFQQFENALKYGNKQRLKESKDLIGAIESEKNIVYTYENILYNPSFKLRVTHHDTKISNVLFDSNDKGLCVIDLDTVMPGYFISDIGDMMRTYLSPANEEEKDFSKIEIRDDFFKAIYDGYMSQMKDELNPEEKKQFIYSGKFMIYMQALRFLVDHLNNDIYYGARYEGQNFIRAGNQMVLLQRLIEKEKELDKIISG
ncbi:MAG TPA: aminoglycoside phosphotransferase family protein [Hanamia sp.]|nr:aminoglycoside phosphotransferase family protein [Hanamia sp.]